MNILLTDISSLTPDQQDLSLAPQADADSFAGLFSRQFPIEPVEEAQDIDIKSFLDKISTLSDTAESFPELAPVSDGDETSVPDPNAIPVNTNLAVKAATELIDQVELPVLKPVSDAMTKALAEGKTGEKLPAGGKGLPLDAALDMTQRSPSEKITAGGGSDVMKGPPAEPRLLQVAALQSGKLETLTTAANLSPEKVSPAVESVSVMHKPVLTGEPAEVIPVRKPVNPEPGQFVARDSLAHARPGPGSRQPGAAEIRPDADFRPTAALSQPERSSGSVTQPPVFAAVGEDRLDDGQRVFKGLRENAPMETVPARETTTDRTLMNGEKIPLPGPAPARNMPGSAEYRNPEFQAQQPANVQQPTVAPSTSAVQSVSMFLTAGTHSSALPPHLETLALPRNADSTAWGNGLSERVNWMINQKQNTATIRLDPPLLGKLDVHVKIADDTTTVSFLTQHAHARELIETASVRLRDFLQESGYQNVNVDVSQRHDQQQARSNAAFEAKAEQQDESGQEQALEQHEQDQASYFIGEGFVDTFA